jgi:hypothetical protein
MNWAESALYNGLGRYAEGLVAARRVVENTELVAAQLFVSPSTVRPAISRPTPPESRRGNSDK